MVPIAPEEGDDVEVEDGGLGDDDGAGSAAKKPVIQNLSVAHGRKRPGLLLGGHDAQNKDYFIIR